MSKLKKFPIDPLISMHCGGSNVLGVARRQTPKNLVLCTIASRVLCTTTSRFTFTA